MKIAGHVGVIGSILIAIVTILGGKPANASGMSEPSCPPCAIKRCPPGTKCRPEPMPCLPCPVQANCPVNDPIIKEVVKEVPVFVEVQVDREIEPARGSWFVPVSVFHLDGLGAAAGLGYGFKNRFTLSAQLMNGPGGETIERSFSKTLRDPHEDDAGYRIRTTEDRSRTRETGLMLTLTIPLGK